MGGLIAVGLLFRWLVRVNRRPRGAELVVALMLALIVIDSALYENQDTAPSGLFHPHVGSLSFRLLDGLVILALAARFVARPPARRVPTQTLLWGALLLWLLAEGVIGLLAHNPKDLVTYEAKAVIYLGMFVLVAAVPPRRWLESAAIRRVVVMSSVIAAVLIATFQANLSLSANLPLIPLSTLGVLGTDAATIFATLGIITLAVALYSERSRVRMLATSLPLLAAPLVSGQRAAIVGLAASLVVLAIAVPFGRHKIRVTGVELGVLCAGAVGAIAALVVIVALSGGAHISIPLVNQLQETFNSRGKQLSASDRVNQWAQARALIAARPWFGWGLGNTYQYYSPGIFQFVITNLTHNIALDLLVRTGVVGLALFLMAASLSIRDSLVAWFRETDARIAALIIASCATFFGLITKGMFESLFEKYRLALLMGGLIGLSVSFATELLHAHDTVREPLPLHGEVPVGAGAR